jgi:ATP-binding cassette subfamily F protein 3
MTRIDGKARSIDQGASNDHWRRVGKMVARKAKTLKRRIQRQLDGEEHVEKPRERRGRIRVDLAPRHWHATTVLRLEGIAKGFGDRTLFADVTLELSRGQRLALVGPNGGGKTTLLEIALGIQPPDEGAVWMSRAAVPFYCDQHLAGLDPDETVYDSLASHTDLNRTQIHYLLSKLLFAPDDLAKRVAHLSGGERTRLVLALLMNARADLLLLDEPTNHLDLPGIEVLQEALRRFPGALLFVSHDRRLVEAVATDVLELRDGALARRPRRAAEP